MKEETIINRYRTVIRQEYTKIYKLLHQLPSTIKTDFGRSLKQLQIFSEKLDHEKKILTAGQKQLLKLRGETLQLSDRLQDLINAIDNFLTAREDKRKPGRSLITADPGAAGYQKVVSFISNQEIKLRKAIRLRNFRVIKSALLIPLHILLQEIESSPIKHSAMLNEAKNILCHQIDGLCKLIPVLKAVSEIEDMRNNIGKENNFAVLPDEIQLKIFSYNNLASIINLIYVDKNLQKLLCQQPTPIWNWLSALYFRMSLPGDYKALKSRDFYDVDSKNFTSDPITYPDFKILYVHNTNRGSIFSRLIEDTINGILLAKISEEERLAYLARWYNARNSQLIKYCSTYFLDYLRRAHGRVHQEKYKQLLDYFFKHHQSQIAGDSKIDIQAAIHSLRAADPAENKPSQSSALILRHMALYEVSKINLDKFTHLLTAACLCSQFNFIGNLFKQGLFRKCWWLILRGIRC